MLAVMKRKAQNDERENPHSNPELKHSQTLAENLYSPPSTAAVVVSHVPVSVGSRTSNTASANSSISSKGGEIERNIAARSPTWLVQDSLRESSLAHSLPTAQLACQVPMTGCLASSNVKPVLTRKLSLDSEEDQGQLQASPHKRARLLFQQDGASVTYPQAKALVPLAPAPSVSVLLARDQDVNVLSPLHVFVRKQIEVFTATAAELSQPAPGRKLPIQLQQVGIRCIHCRDVPSRKRVKRAVCYPSSVGRVYHSVSDMKFDHFSTCKHLPEDVRATFEALKSEGKRGNDKKTTTSGKSSSSFASSTAQYYHDAALLMGMVDGKGGIFLDAANQFCHTISPQVTPTSLPKLTLDEHSHLPQAPTLPTENPPKKLGTTCDLVLHGSRSAPQESNNADSVSKMPLSSSFHDSALSSLLVPVALATPSDKEHLNPLHCFVRQHIEIFPASDEDIAAPAPGRKNRVLLGQVGIRCIHCARLPIKDRVKRAVCYPPSVNGIYHSASNMKFDHFGLCQGLPPQSREKFAALKTACTRRGTAGNNGSRGGMANSTAQFYRDSAAQMGLVDTASGIRFRSCIVKQVGPEDNFQPIPTGMTALMMAVSQAV
jgi:hypothetical protein